jgi:hypothetical protein
MIIFFFFICSIKSTVALKYYCPTLRNELLNSKTYIASIKSTISSSDQDSNSIKYSKELYKKEDSSSISKNLDPDEIVIPLQLEETKNYRSHDKYNEYNYKSPMKKMNKVKSPDNIQMNKKLNSNNDNWTRKETNRSNFNDRQKLLDRVLSACRGKQNHANPVTLTEVHTVYCITFPDFFFLFFNFLFF